MNTKGVPKKGYTGLSYDLFNVNASKDFLSMSNDSYFICFLSFEIHK